MKKTLLKVMVIGLVLAACNGGAGVTTTTAAGAGTTTAPGSETTAAEATTTTEAAQQAEGPVIAARFVLASLDPSQGSILINNLPIYDFWVGSDTVGNLVPEYGVAESWDVEHSDTGSVWTFHIRDNVFFHDGVQVTAEDMKFSLEFFMREASQSGSSANFRELIKTMTVVDEFTLQIDTNFPYGFLDYDLSRAAQSEGTVLPKHYIEEVGDAGFAENPIGSGPCRYVSQNLAEGRVEMAAVEEHWLFPPSLYENCFTLIGVTETSTAMAMIRAGEADVADISIEQVAAMEGEGYVVTGRPEARTMLLRFGNQWDETSYLHDSRVRAALGMAIDRQSLVDDLFLGRASVSGAPFFGPAGPGYSLERFPATEYDPEGAKALMEEAIADNGWDKVELTFNLFPPAANLLAGEAIFSMWNDAFGDVATITIAQLDAATNREMVVDKNVKNTVILADTNDRLNWHAQWLGQQTCEGELGGYAPCDAELEELIDVAARALSREDMVEPYAAAIDRMREITSGSALMNLDYLFVLNPETVSPDWEVGRMNGFYNFHDLIFPGGAFRVQG